jgi:hypothetical protein
MQVDLEIPLVISILKDLDVYKVKWKWGDTGKS